MQLSPGAAADGRAPAQEGWELSQLQRRCSRWDREGQARMSPQIPEKQGWSHQSCSLAPISRVSPEHSLHPWGHCPSSCRFLQASKLNLHLWFPLPRTAVPSMGSAASSQTLFPQLSLPLPSFIPHQAPSPSSLLCTSRKSHFNLSGLTWQPPAPTGQEKPRGSSSSSGPASPTSPHAQDVLPDSGAGHAEGWSGRRIPAVLRLPWVCREGAEPRALQDLRSPGGLAVIPALPEPVETSRESQAWARQRPETPDHGATRIYLSAP